MSRQQRIGLLVAAAAVAVVALLLIKPGEDDKTGSDAKTQAQAETTSPSKPAPPPVTRITVRGAKPIGGIKKITAKKGDVIRLTVTSDVSDEVHVHGFDVAREVAPGKPARFKFPAKFEGVFEIELENRGEQIAQLTVAP